jgi:hypothetical protein
MEKAGRAEVSFPQRGSGGEILTQPGRFSSERSIASDAKIVEKTRAVRTERLD